MLIFIAVVANTPLLSKGRYLIVAKSRTIRQSFYDCLQYIIGTAHVALRKQGEVGQGLSLGTALSLS